MAEFLLWDNTTGRIMQTGHSSSDKAEGLDPETGFMLMLVPEVPQGMSPWEIDPNEKYVDPATWAILDRPELALDIPAGNGIADSETEFVIGNVPVGTQVEIRGAGRPRGGIVDDGTLELTFDEPGDYTVIFLPFPAKRAKVTISAD